MEVKEKKDIKYTVILTQGEAKLLKDLVQNPLIEDEDIESTKMRRSLWKALDRYEL